MTEVPPDPTGIVASQAVVPQAIPLSPFEVRQVTFVTLPALAAVPCSDTVAAVVRMIAGEPVTETFTSAAKAVAAKRNIAASAEILFMKYFSAWKF
jgi:hypothetical protein